MLVLLALAIAVMALMVNGSPAPLPSTPPSLPRSCSAISSIYPSPTAASSFCSSYLDIKTLSITKTVTSSTSATTTPTDASTSVVFIPGNPPAAKVRRSEEPAPLLERGSCDQEKCLESRNLSPKYISSACSCLSLSTPTTTTTVIAYASTTVTASVVTETVYPCATANGALPSPGPAYGKYQSPNSLGLSNSIYTLSSAEGASAQSCCNTCFFELANCVQAWWYFYEGCVVSQATDFSSATGTDVSSVCPAGLYDGLTYVPDSNPPSRSTGDIAGPCGVSYTNF